MTKENMDQPEKTMEVRYLPNRESYAGMKTDELRKAFVLDRLFVPGAVSMVYSDADRLIAGGAIPLGRPLILPASKKERASAYFAERREVGIVNIGDAGQVRADESLFDVGKKDMVYVGRGTKEIELRSANVGRPAVFYFVSYPAHAVYPAAHVPFAAAQASPLGSQEAANKRTIYKYIHPGGAKSCQLVMGLTDLERGSVWNSMPPHTHQRRTEVYLYFDLAQEDMVVHLMGMPGETRSLILRDREAALSPAWSIHCGAGTASYSFVWAMGGENQEFSDMDPVPLRTLF